jgi:hypothetical protein
MRRAKCRNGTEFVTTKMSRIYLSDHGELTTTDTSKSQRIKADDFITEMTERIEDLSSLMHQRRKRRLPAGAAITSRKTCLLLTVSLWSSTPCYALPKKEPSWSFMTDNFDSLYFSEDENEERVLAALAKVSLDDDSESTFFSSRYADAEANDKQHESDNDRSPIKTKISREPHVPQKTLNKLSYVTLPEAYRAVPAVSIQPVPTQSTAPPPATFSQRQVTTMINPTTSISPWIQKFLASCPRDALLPLPLDFLMDNFNLAQLAPVVERIGLHGLSDQQRLQILQSYRDNSQPFPIYRQALQLLVQQQSEEDTVDIPLHVETATRALYLLLHQRFCLSPRGLDMVRRRFLAASGSSRVTVFGNCPNPSCCNLLLLPLGAFDNYQVVISQVNQTTAPTRETLCKRYCYSCRHVYLYRASKVDGCAWGTSFCHLFVMMYGKQFLLDLRTKDYRQEVYNDSKQTVKQVYSKGKTTDAAIFGFRLHSSSGQ